MIDEPPETSEIQAFVIAVDEGSVSAAAKVLSQPRATISRRISRLEERLGVRLLHRTTRQLALTEVGEEYYVYACGVLESVRAATAAVRQPGDVPRGRLRVSVMPMENAAFRDILLRFVETYPLVELELIVATAMLDLREGKVDVALRASTELDADLVARKLLSTRLCAVASPDYLSRLGMPKTTDQLEGHSCLLGFSRGERAATHWPLLDGGEVRVRGHFFSNYLELLYDAALRGLGITLLPEVLVASAVAEGRLVPILRNELGAITTIALVYPDRHLLKPAVRAFVDHIVEHFPRIASPSEFGGATGR